MRLKRKILGGLLVMTLAGAAEAGQITDLQLYDGTSNAPVVTVSYTNPDGTGSNSGLTYADPQVSNGTTTPLYYCIDLWHDNALGDTYTITPVSSISFANTSTFADVDNRLAWLVNQPQTTVDQRAAVQLALWYTIDNKGFSYTGGDSTLRTDYNALISFAGYNPATSYNAQLWSATHNAGNTLYQDLIDAVPGNSPPNNPVPEPGSFILAGIGLAAAVGFRVVRRRRRLAATA
jgi:hypothetical protein